MDRSSHLSGDRPQVVADHVGRQGDLSLHVVAIVLTRHAARLDARHIADQDLAVVGFLQWDLSELLARGQSIDTDDRADHRTRYLDLYLISDTALGVGPIVRNHKTTRGRRGDQSSGNIDRHQSGQPRLLAIDINLQGRIVHRLAKLQIAQRRYLGEHLLELIGELTVFSKVGPVDDNLDRSWGSETHDFVDDIRGFKRKSHVRHLLIQTDSQAFLELLIGKRKTILKVDVQDRFFRAPRPLVDGIDRKIRMDHSYIPKCQLHVLAT